MERWALAAMLVVLFGCATSGSAERRLDVAKGLNNSANRIQETRFLTRNTLDALDRIARDPSIDLTPKFKAFEDLMKQLETRSQEVEKEVGDMIAKREEYLMEWDQQLAAMHNEDIRTRAAERRDEVSVEMEELHANFLETRAAFQPLMADLRDIRKALQLDLTPQGVEVTRPTIEQGRESGKNVLAALDKLIASFRKQGIQLAPPAGPTK